MDDATISFEISTRQSEPGWERSYPVQMIDSGLELAIFGFGTRDRAYLVKLTYDAIRANFEDDHANHPWLVTKLVVFMNHLQE
jgi:hypothetical protein